MRGGILIERDFIQQYYSYGLAGVLILMGVWIVMIVYCGINLLFGYKQGKWSYINIIVMMSLCLGYLSSYVSGHTFDELTTSMFISLLFGFLVKEVRSKNVEKI